MDSKTAGALLNEFYSLVDYTKPSFQISLFAIAFNPTAWNYVARNGTRLSLQHFYFCRAGFFHLVNDVLSLDNGSLTEVSLQSIETRPSRSSLAATRAMERTSSPSSSSRLESYVTTCAFCEPWTPGKLPAHQ